MLISSGTEQESGGEVRASGTGAYGMEKVRSNAGETGQTVGGAMRVLTAGGYGAGAQIYGRS